MTEGDVSDGFLRVYQCPRWLADGGGPERHCGFIQGSPGVCPYDHGEPVELVEIVATVHCSDCSCPIPVDDGRAPDGRLICAECQLRYIAVNQHPEGVPLLPHERGSTGA